MESFELDTAATSSSDVGALNQKSDFENATSGSDSDGYEDNTTERLLGDEPKGAVGVVDDSPETIALRTLHTSDNPALNPWTLRMFILGNWTYVFPSGNIVDTYRHRSILFWLCSSDYLSLQATSRGCVCNLSHRYQLCRRNRNVDLPSKKRHRGKMDESTEVQLQRALGHHSHGKLSVWLSLCYRSPRHTEALLRHCAKSRGCHLASHVFTTCRVWYGWYPS